MNSNTIAHPTAVRKPAVEAVCQIVFTWPGYDPEKALDMFATEPFDQITYAAAARAKLPLVSGCTLGDIYSWMQTNNLVVLHAPGLAPRRIDQTKSGNHWQGRYLLTIGREVLQ